MHDIEIFQVPHGRPHAGLWSFAVDGHETLYYSPQKWGVERVVDRLRRGQTHSLGAAVVQATAPQPQRVQAFRLPAPASAPGGPAPKRRWSYTLDGQPSGREFASENEARAAGGLAAFLTRGKLGRLQEAANAFHQQFNAPCAVKVEGGRFLAEAEDGARYRVAFPEADHGFVFHRI